MSASQVWQRPAHTFARLRRRFRPIDHVIRAGVRYDKADGGRLAAAITYYAFFALFACALLGLSVLGFVLNNATVLRTVQDWVSANLPRLSVQSIRSARGTVGVIAFVVLPVSGVLWVDSLRSSIRAIWRFEQYPGRFLVRQAIDLGILFGFLILFGVSLTVSGGTQAILHWLVVDAGNADGSIGHSLLDVAGFVLGLAVNWLLAIAVLTVLPRIHMKFRRVYGPALLVAIGLEVLNSIGRIYVHRTEANPAYQVVAASVGLLVFLSLLNQMILYAAAWTATSTYGPVTDFGTGPRSTTPPVEIPALACASIRPSAIARRHRTRSRNNARRR